MKKYLFLLFAAAMILSSCENKADPDSYDTASSKTEKSIVSVSASSTQTTSTAQITEMSTTTVSTTTSSTTGSPAVTTTVKQKVDIKATEKITGHAIQRETEFITDMSETEATTTTTTSSTTLKEKTPAEDTLWVTVNGAEFKAKFCDTQAADEFKTMLPLTFDMSELNGNEKYIYTDTSFTTSAESVGHINKGELMLYGDSCVVLFYDNFDTPYSYTKLGYIENTEGLENAVGTGSVTVRFSAE